METLVQEWKNNPKQTVLTLGVNGDDIQEMLMFAREAERMAEESGVDFILAARPPYYGKTEQDIKEYYEALATVAKRPVIIQTYVNEDCPAPSAELLIDLAQRYPDVYGWIKEESNKLEANDRQQAELEGKPAVKTVFSAWGRMAVALSEAPDRYCRSDFREDCLCSDYFSCMATDEERRK